MKKLRPVMMSALALIAILALSVTTAYAEPSYSTPCSGCHGGINVPVTATVFSAGPATTTYDVSAPTGHAIAVFDGSSKLVSINSSSGRFTVANGGTYTIYAVKGPGTGNGIGQKSVSPIAPPVDSTPPTTVSDAESGYVRKATIKLTATDAGSGVAHTYYKLDGGTTTEGKTIVVDSLGDHTLEFWSADVAGNTESPNTVDFSVIDPATDGGQIQIAGGTRYDTALQVSRSTFATGSCDTVVIATGAKYPDALGASGLAGAADCPVLLVVGDTLPAATRAEIERLTSGHTTFTVYVSGGSAAVSLAMESSLRAQLPGATVTRVAGGTRYDTANAMALEAKAILAAKGLPYSGEAMLVTGRDFTDALLAGPVAYRQHMPILLIGVTGVDAPLKTTIDALGVTHVNVIGSTGAAYVPDSYEADLEAYLVGPDNVTRVGSSADCYEMSVQVAEWTVGTYGHGWDGVGVSTGEKYPDALGAGPFLGEENRVLLLTRKNDLPSGVSSALTSHKADIGTVHFFGGDLAVTPAVRDEVALALL